MTVFLSQRASVVMQDDREAVLLLLAHHQTHKGKLVVAEAVLLVESLVSLVRRRHARLHASHAAVIRVRVGSAHRRTTLHPQIQRSYAQEVLRIQLRGILDRPTAVHREHLVEQLHDLVRLRLIPPPSPTSVKFEVTLMRFTDCGALR